GGMRQRIVGAIAISCGPRLLIADEPTTSLDVTIQAQYLSLLRDLQRAQRLAMIFITHNLGIVARMCDAVAVMYAGRIVESGPGRGGAGGGHLHRAPAPVYARVDRVDSPPGRGQWPTDRHRRTAARSRRAARGMRVPPTLSGPPREMRYRTAARERRRRRAPHVVLAARMTPLLEARELVKHFPVRRGLLGGSDNAVRAVDGVSFVIEPGATLGLVG